MLPNHRASQYILGTTPTPLIPPPKLRPPPQTVKVTSTTSRQNINNINFEGGSDKRVEEEKEGEEEIHPNSLTSLSSPSLGIDFYSSNSNSPSPFVSTSTSNYSPHARDSIYWNTPPSFPPPPRPDEQHLFVNQNNFFEEEKDSYNNEMEYSNSYYQISQFQNESNFHQQKQSSITPNSSITSASSLLSNSVTSPYSTSINSSISKSYKNNNTYTQQQQQQYQSSSSSSSSNSNSYSIQQSIQILSDDEDDDDAQRIKSNPSLLLNNNTSSSIPTHTQNRQHQSYYFRLNENNNNNNNTNICVSPTRGGGGEEEEEKESGEDSGLYQCPYFNQKYSKEEYHCVGFLTKQGGGRSVFGRKSWKRRWFVIPRLMTFQLRTVQYFKFSLHEGYIPLGGFELESKDLSSIRLIEQGPDEQGQCIVIPLRERIYYLKGDNENDNLMWFHYLSRPLTKPL